jgi:hypothetical protein
VAWLLGSGMFSGIAWFAYLRKRLTISNELATYEAGHVGVRRPQPDATGEVG